MSTPQRLIQQIEPVRHLVDDRVVAAFEAVPRHVFLPDIPPETVYTDEPIYTRTDDRGGFLGGSDRPSQLMQLLTAAALEPGQNVLEIGTGTGHSAALIRHLVGESGRVTTLDIDRGTVASAQDHLINAHKGAVNVVHVDGVGGYDPRASYDRIISTVAVWDMPPAWVRQVRPNGLIVTPIYLDGLQIMGAFRVGPKGTLACDAVSSCSFVPMLGVAAPPIQHLYLGGGSALRLYSNEVSHVDSVRLHTMMLEDAERCHLGVALSSSEYWDGVALYLMMNVPVGYNFVCYTVEGSKLVYGLSGRGFALIAPTSATFVGADDMGDAHCFAGVDAFLEIDSLLNRWREANQPDITRLRVRLIPRPDDVAEGRVPDRGYLYRRPHHQLHVFLTDGSESDDEQSAG